MDLKYYTRFAIHILTTKWRVILLTSSIFLFLWVNLYLLPSAPTYKVIFDAGSTGTRIHVFHFNSPKFSLRNPEAGEGDLTLIDIPLFAQVKGGLSDYANNVVGCRPGLLSLLEQAKSVIPRSEWPKTEVVLMATAGLRLLKPEQADALLAEARDVISKHSTFRIGTIDTIDGKIEAKLIYTMTHFVTASGGNARMAIVDLGGGSVQLAYQTESQLVDLASVREVESYLERSKRSTLYLHSWLGYGLVAFRMKALEMEADGQPHPCVPEWTPPGTVYKYGDKTRTVIPRRPATVTGASPVKACLDLIHSALNGRNSTCKLPIGLPTPASGQCGLNGSWLGPSDLNSIQEWRMFSYIFDLAAEEGLVPAGSKDATLTANDFLGAAKKHCERMSGTGDKIEWWKCIDLLYVSALLTEGFKLEADFPLKVTKRLVYRGEIELEAAWPLGAALAAIKDEL